MKASHCTAALLAAGVITMTPALLCAQGTKPPMTAAKPKTAPPKEESQATLQKDAKITLAAATATALKEVPGGKVSDHELEREKGKLIYSFDIKVAGKSGIEEVAVDAITGAMVSKSHESLADEAKEAAADRAKAKKDSIKKAGGGA